MMAMQVQNTCIEMQGAEVSHSLLTELKYAKLHCFLQSLKLLLAGYRPSPVHIMAPLYFSHA